MNIILIICNLATIVAGAFTVYNGYRIGDGTGALFMALGVLFVVLGTLLLLGSL